MHQQASIIRLYIIIKPLIITLVPPLPYHSIVLFSIFQMELLILTYLLSLLIQQPITFMLLLIQ